MKVQETEETYWGLPVRKWIRAIAIACAIGLFCGLIVGVAMKAVAVRPDDGVSIPGTTANMCPPDFPCGPQVKKAQRDWKNGRFGRTHGFRPKNFYRAPIKARELIIRKLDRWLDIHPRSRDAITVIYRRHDRTGARNAEFRRVCTTYQSTGSYATCLYWDNQQAATCVGNTGFSGYPAAGSSTQCQKTIAKNGKMSRDDLQKTIAVFGCTSAGAWGFISGTIMAKGKWQIGLITGGFAEANCFASAWIYFTH